MVNRGVRLGGALLATLAMGLTGCTSLGKRAKGPFHFAGLYLQDRYEDLTEVVDLGLMITLKSGFALYTSVGSFTPVGGGYVDGYFFGIGGGQFLGIGHARFLHTRHYFIGGGLMLWGYEEYGWDVFDTEDMSTLRCLDTGAAALVLPPHPRPGTCPSWRNYVHAGNIGFIANANLFEALDFLFGWFGFDFCGDDGVPLGKWAWQTYDEADVNSFEFYEYHRGFESY